MDAILITERSGCSLKYTLFVRDSGINRASSGSLPCIGIAARRIPMDSRQMRGWSDVDIEARTRVSPSRRSHPRGIIKEGTEGEQGEKEIKNDNPDARTHDLTLIRPSSPPRRAVLLRSPP